MQRMDGEVNIRALLLCFDRIGKFDPIAKNPGVYGVGKGRMHRMSIELAIVYLQLRNMFFQSTDKGFLPDGLVWVKFTAHLCGEILDPNDLMDGIKKILKKLFEIEPFVRSVFDSTVIKIKPINVDVGAQFAIPQKKQRPPQGGLAPKVETVGVVG